MKLRKCPQLAWSRSRTRWQADSHAPTNIGLDASQIASPLKKLIFTHIFRWTQGESEVDARIFSTWRSWCRGTASRATSFSFPPPPRPFSAEHPPPEPPPRVLLL